jgi:hypothetical protein
MGHYSESCLLSNLAIRGGDKILTIELHEEYPKHIYWLLECSGSQYRDSIKEKEDCDISDIELSEDLLQKIEALILQNKSTPARDYKKQIAEHEKRKRSLNPVKRVVFGEYDGYGGIDLENNPTDENSVLMFFNFNIVQSLFSDDIATLDHLFLAFKTIEKMYYMRKGLDLGYKGRQDETINELLEKQEFINTIQKHLTARIKQQYEDSY